MRILLAEDDKNLNHMLTAQLNTRGFLVDACFDGEDALYYAGLNIYDVILLDRMLPFMEGTQILAKIREKNITAPVIMITALGTLEDKISGFHAGADDYLVKPFAFEELLARIQSVTRRSPLLFAQNSLRLADIHYLPDTDTLTGPMGSCSLSKREGALLEVFLRNPESTLSRSMLLLKVWGPESEVEDGNLDNYIHFIRRRLKTVGSSLSLKTIRGVGYCLTSTPGK
ncbi:MAG: response regulator transcription factor [Bacteroidales bacterium]|nr:response regulator transcription factor [Lachnoclostridium sp.]MCM1383516.1 response regulator transcription factor [Lachnoclostridium sp.]MCM1464201.1 response regulator transcription factor [Bacteroidales bacterium]